LDRGTTLRDDAQKKRGGQLGCLYETVLNKSFNRKDGEVWSNGLSGAKGHQEKCARRGTNKIEKGGIHLHGGGGEGAQRPKESKNGGWWGKTRVNIRTARAAMHETLVDRLAKTRRANEIQGQRTEGEDKKPRRVRHRGGFDPHKLLWGRAQLRLVSGRDGRRNGRKREAEKAGETSRAQWGGARREPTGQVEEIPMDGGSKVKNGPEGGNTIKIDQRKSVVIPLLNPEKILGRTRHLSKVLTGR